MYSRSDNERSKQYGQGISAVFLDRDGVLNEEVGHLSGVEEIRLLPGSSEAVKQLNDRDIPVVVVTNQSIIGRGLCTEAQLQLIHDTLGKMLLADGARVTRFYYCPHHPTAGIGEYGIACECRKPGSGMLLQAARDLELDLQRSVMVGDSITDLEAGWQAGCRTVLVVTGHGAETRLKLANSARQPDFVAERLTHAVHWILQDQ